MRMDEHQNRRDEPRRLAWTRGCRRALDSRSCHDCAKRPSSQDATTSQVRLFLRAKRPCAALVVALVRVIPWRSIAVLAIAAIMHLGT